LTSIFKSLEWMKSKYRFLGSTHPRLPLNRKVWRHFECTSKNRTHIENGDVRRRVASNALFEIVNQNRAFPSAKPINHYLSPSLYGLIFYLLKKDKKLTLLQE